MQNICTIKGKELKRLSKKDFNKVSAFVEKVFTWDNQVKTNTSFYIVNYEKHIRIHIFRGSAGYWSSFTIELNNKKIFDEDLVSFENIRKFKNMIRALEA